MRLGRLGDRTPRLGRQYSHFVDTMYILCGRSTTIVYNHYQCHFLMSITDLAVLTMVELQRRIFYPQRLANGQQKDVQRINHQIEFVLFPSVNYLAIPSICYSVIRSWFLPKANGVCTINSTIYLDDIIWFAYGQTPGSSRINYLGQQAVPQENDN